ncbi:MAG: PepSY domain-containing protein, partial [Lachnospiraceae bacterium]
TTQNSVDYALRPVWRLTTNWHGKSYHFAINGQTGKLIGDLPIDKGRFFSLLAGITIPLGILLKLFIF